MRQKVGELQGERDEYIVIHGDLHIPLSEMDRSSRQKNHKV